MRILMASREGIQAQHRALPHVLANAKHQKQQDTYCQFVQLVYSSMRLSEKLLFHRDPEELPVMRRQVRSDPYQ